MTCCAEDISFAAVVCKHPSAAKLKDRDWYTITAEVKHEFFPEYQGMGPVLYVKSLEPAKKPDDDICYKIKFVCLNLPIDRQSGDFFIENFQNYIIYFRRIQG